MNRFLGHVIPKMLLAPSSSASADTWITPAIKLSLYDSVILVVGADDAGAGNDLGFNVRQGKTAAGGDEKDLAVRQWYRAEAAALAVDTDVVEVAPSTVESIANAVALEGDHFNLAFCEVGADELDEGFDWISLGHSAGDAAKLITAFAFLCGPRYAVQPSVAPAPV